MVVEAACENARGIGDLLQGSAKPRRRDDGVRGLQDLGAPRRIDRRLVGDGGELHTRLSLIARGTALLGIVAGAASAIEMRSLTL